MIDFIDSKLMLVGLRNSQMVGSIGTGGTGLGSTGGTGGHWGHLFPEYSAVNQKVSSLFLDNAPFS